MIWIGLPLSYLLFVGWLLLQRVACLVGLEDVVSDPHLNRLLARIVHRKVQNRIRHCSFIDVFEVLQHIGQ